MKKSKKITIALISALTLFAVSCGNNAESVEQTTSQNGQLSDIKSNKDYTVVQDGMLDYLTWTTTDGNEQKVLIGDRTGMYITEEERRPTEIMSVASTQYSDIVTTSYVYSGAITSSIEDQFYIHGDKVERSNILTLKSYGNAENDYKPIPPDYLDDRVALINNGVVNIYDDTTGELIQELNGVKLYDDKLDEIYDFQSNGDIMNIQAVGEDFIVVNMLQPFTFAEDESEQFLGEWYYTTVINLDTLEMIPVYESSDAFKNREMLIDGEMARASVGFGGTVGDGVTFVERKDDGKLMFECNYGYADAPKVETIEIEYK